MASMIGIKVANGEFYPILEENTAAKKRLVLTTAHDDQKSVQIDLYRNPSDVMQKAQYMGTVVVENLPQRAKGEPSIELDIFSTEVGVITAEAFDTDDAENAEHHRLQVSLKSLKEKQDDVMDLPDFDLEFGQKDGSPYYKNDAPQKKLPKKILPLIIAAAVLLVVAVGLGLWFFVLKKDPNKTSDAAPPANTERTAPPATPVEPPPPPPLVEPPLDETATGETAEGAAEAGDAEPPPATIDPVAPVAETVAPVQPTAVIVPPPAQPIKPVAPTSQAAGASRKRAPAPVYSAYKVPPTIPRDGMSYKLAWGDTLWDVCAAFYRNPWYYKWLARQNGIRDANRIESGRTIKIPPPPK